MLTDYVTWDEAQWERYEEETIAISLEDFGKLLTALELLSGGKRLNEEQRAAWDKVTKRLFPVYVDRLGKISQGEPT